MPYFSELIFSSIFLHPSIMIIELKSLNVWVIYVVEHWIHHMSSSVKSYQIIFFCAFSESLLVVAVSCHLIDKLTKIQQSTDTKWNILIGPCYYVHWLWKFYSGKKQSNWPHGQKYTAEEALKHLLETIEVIDPEKTFVCVSIMILSFFFCVSSWIDRTWFAELMYLTLLV